MNETNNRIPIIKLWNRIVAPLQGDVSDHQAAELMNDVLQEIQTNGASGLALDLTGVWLMDSHLCAVLSHIVAAASLMGAKTVISGMKPEIAMTLQTMGVEIAAQTALTLEEALEILGVQVTHQTSQNEDKWEEFWGIDSRDDSPLANSRGEKSETL